MGTKWIPCGEKFIVGDVIRWIEPIWLELKKKKKGGKKKVEKLGTRRVTAEVVKIDGSGYVSLSILECEILSTGDGPKPEPLKKGESLRKLRRTIGKGNGERLKWSREDARSLVVSKFLN